VLDVARAADPSRYSQAAAKLHRIAANPAGGAAFGGMFDAYQAEEAAFAADDALFAAESAAERAVAAAPPISEIRRERDAFGAFEAMVLANFVESMMPSDKASAFGGGTAGQIWASMMAEKIAGEIADAGGVGIADRLRMAQAGPTSMGFLASDEVSAIDGAAMVDAVSANSQRAFLAQLRPMPADLESSSSTF
jgi:hypothetical protein